MKKIIFVLAIATIGCNAKKEKGMSNDTHTFSSKSDVRVEHLSLDINVNFDSKIIEGTANYTINKNHADDTIHLDVKGISIIDVLNAETNDKLNFNIAETDKVKGEDLAINVKGVNAISIKYKTANDAAALQWLTPEQTADKKHPFLYTQSQAILARTWIPCQDGPGVRFTYDARVTVPKELIALMSAENPVSKNDSGIYHFKQVRAIPSYLMA
jgi:aminopeptidase N